MAETWNKFWAHYRRPLPNKMNNTLFWMYFSEFYLSHTCHTHTHVVQGSLSHTRTHCTANVTIVRDKLSEVDHLSEKHFLNLFSCCCHWKWPYGTTKLSSFQIVLVSAKDSRFEGNTYMYIHARMHTRTHSAEFVIWDPTCQHASDQQVSDTISSLRSAQ